MKIRHSDDLIVWMWIGIAANLLLQLKMPEAVALRGVVALGQFATVLAWGAMKLKERSR